MNGGEPHAAMSEDDLIASYFAPIAGRGSFNLLDDAACIRPPPGCDLVLTADALVAGVHFFADDPADAVAKKALRVNLSDLAAKGARPRGFLLTIALPQGWSADYLQAFTRGLGEDAGFYGCPLLGGDTVRTPGPLTLSISAFGTVPSGRMAARTGIRADDCLYVSGTIGDGALGLRLRLAGDEPWIAALSAESKAFLARRYLLPEPRLALRRTIRDHARSGMDVSDGLIGDLAKMLRVSGVTADIDLASVPLSAAAREAIGLTASLFDVAVTGGDDYEVLTSVSADSAQAFEAAAARAGVSVTKIGVARAGDQKPVFRDASGAHRTFEKPSFSHI